MSGKRRHHADDTLVDLAPSRPELHVLGEPSTYGIGVDELSCLCGGG